LRIPIRNKVQIIENGKTQADRRARSLALESFEAALNAVNPRKLIKSKLSLQNAVLKINNYSFDLTKFRNLYVLGGGKASGAMAEALEEIMEDHITEGLINVPCGSSYVTNRIKFHETTHPIPNDEGVRGTQLMLKIAEKATKDDLIIFLVSGGGSSLMPLPREGITIDAKINLTETLLKSGATINEMNTVRKHISAFKGGQLAKIGYPATILNLILSDVVGDPLENIASGPTVPDFTTFSQAIKILKKYYLWIETPESIKNVLLKGKKGLIRENPRESDRIFNKTQTVIIGNNRTASLASYRAFKNEGLNTCLLTSTLEGEAKNVGTILASIANEILNFENPLKKPAGVIVGGETTVTVMGKGKGGRNQELALAAAIKLKVINGISIASMSTAGIDGPTDAAGAIIDGHTLKRAEEKGLNPEIFLSNNNSNEFFSNLGDLIFTGPTSTNVNDISLIIVV